MIDGEKKKTQIVDFGFREVDAREKTSLVQDVFHRVAGRYDIMNDVMSLGIHRRWKDEFVKNLPLRPGFLHLDLASGTGDITARIQEEMGRKNYEGQIIATDLNFSMLRANGQPFLRGTPVMQVCANAEVIPFADHTFDGVTIAFGLRNVTHKDAALQEALRVLKPGGVFLCLEFSKVTLPVLHKLYGLYTFHALPKLGKWIAGDGEAYRYLAESIDRFCGQDELATLMKSVGFSHVSYENLSFGVVAVHRGWK